jgi:hypothetical protein
MSELCGGSVSGAFGNSHEQPGRALPTNQAGTQPYGGPAQGSAIEPYPQLAVPMRRPGQHRIVPAGGRFGAALLETLLILCTFGIGWLVWAAVTWSDGQTPAKKMLGHVVADADNGAPFTWGQMALREFCIKGLLGWLLNFLTCSLYLWFDGLMIFGADTRTLHDRMVNSIVRYV